MSDDEPVLRRETAYTGIPRNRTQRTFTDWANHRAFHENQPPASAFTRARQDVPPRPEYPRSPLQSSHTVNTPTSTRAHTPSGTKDSKPKSTSNKENTEDPCVSPTRPDTPDPRRTMPTPTSTAASPATATPEHEANEDGEDHEDEDEDDAEDDAEDDDDEDDEDSIDEGLARARNGFLGYMSPPGSINSRLAMRASFRGSTTSLDEKYRGPCSTPTESVVDLSDSSNSDNDARPHWRVRFRDVFRGQAYARERARLRSLGIAVRQYYNQLVEAQQAE
jgi:hypothetical protein